jgi:hypothetical protein
MILFDDVVELFDLTDLNACLLFGVVALDRPHEARTGRHVRGAACCVQTLRGKAWRWWRAICFSRRAEGQ